MTSHGCGKSLTGGGGWTLVVMGFIFTFGVYDRIRAHPNSHTNKPRVKLERLIQP